MLRQVKLETIEEYNPYNQISQTSEIKWAFLNRVVGEKFSFKELHYNVTCREYLGDVLVCANLNISLPTIYGLSLTNKKASLKETLLSVSLSKENIKGFMSRMVFLRAIEKKMGIAMTRIYPTEKNTTSNNAKLVLVGDKKWMTSPLLISIYSAIIRSLTYNYAAPTFKDHINKLINLSVGGNDSHTFRLFKENNIDIFYLLLNIDKVLGDNPLTGVDDIELYTEKESIQRVYDTVLLESGTSQRSERVSWGLMQNHSAHGMISFVNNLYYHRQSNNNLSSIGTEWVYNYLRLLASGEDIQVGLDDPLNLILHTI